MLKALRDYAKTFWDENKPKMIKVTSLAGSSHSEKSLHYQGGVMDISCYNVFEGGVQKSFNHCQKLVDFCK